MVAVARIQELLGGEGVTGPLRDERDLVLLIRRGVPTEAVGNFLERSRLTFNSIEANVASRRTYVRRQKARQPLDPVESDRLVRLVRLMAMAEDTFGAPEKAQAWFGRESRALEGQTPLSLADTDLGARRVETLLGQIGHGIAA